MFNKNIKYVLFFLLICFAAEAKKASPITITKTFNNIKYYVSNEIEEDNGLYLKVDDKYKYLIYKMDYNSDLEKDMQNVYIKDLSLEKDKVKLTDERGIDHYIFALTKSN